MGGTSLQSFSLSSSRSSDSLILGTLGAAEFDRLLKPLRVGLAGYVTRRVGESSSEDVLQEVCLTGWQAVGRFERLDPQQGVRHVVIFLLQKVQEATQDQDIAIDRVVGILFIQQMVYKGQDMCAF